MTRQTFLKLCSLMVAGNLLPLNAKTIQKPMPALFLGHGSPMNIILENDFTMILQLIGEKLQKPKAILVISAHWVNDRTSLSSVDNAQTIYDFGGFPSALYETSYKVKGSRYLAKKLNDYPVTARGLDHGAWSILKHMYPKANIPTMQLSINKNLSLQEHFDLGKKLSVLREHGVLIIGSGGITHNLQHYDHDNINASPEKWAVEFDSYVKSAIEKKDFDALIHLENAGRSASESHPTLEHYIPLLYIAGMTSNEDASSFLYEGFQNSAFSMRAWKIE